MPSLTSLFNPTFFMFLGITVLIIAFLVLYFENKSRQQTHKISSMLSLVSSLAEEINSIKFALNTINGGFNGGSAKQSEGRTFSEQNKLIDVSDDDNSDDDIENECESNNDESSEFDSSDESGDDNDDIMNLEEHDFSNIKVLKLNLGDSEVFNNNLLSDQCDHGDNCDHDDNDEPDDLDSDSIFSDKGSDKGSDKDTDITNNAVFDLKTINISDAEYSNIVDYKKLPVGRLRSIVSDKHLSTDPSKLKKPELLKLLGCD